MLNAYYKDQIHTFLSKSIEEIIGEITLANKFEINSNTVEAWKQQIVILQKQLNSFKGNIFFEFSIPRMGKRIDCLLVIENVVFVLEFKVGESEYLNHNLDQVWDYALDLKNFHKPSHDAIIVPVLVATEAKNSEMRIITTSHNDDLVCPIRISSFKILLRISQNFQMSCKG